MVLCRVAAGGAQARTTYLTLLRVKAVVPETAPLSAQELIMIFCMAIWPDQVSV